MKLKKLRRTANHLIFLRRVKKVTGDKGGARLITRSDDKYTTVAEIDYQIKHCKQILREGLR